VSTGAESTITETVTAPAAEEVVADEGVAAEAGRLSDRVTVIEPVSGWLSVNFRELWTYRELAGILAWRDFRVRYKQTFVGAGWAIIVPFMQMVVMTIVFGKFAKFPSNGLAYPIFSYAGLLLWGYFGNAFQRASNSVVTSVSFITKVYFPRVLLPVASVFSPLVDFCFASTVMFGLMVYFHTYPGPELAVAPVFMLLAALTALGVGMFFAAVNVRYRDVPYVIPFLIQIWWFASPVAYSAESLSANQQLVASLNPMFSIINGFRWTVLGTPAPTAAQLAISVTVMMAFLLAGLALFKRGEPSFADTI
jgi:lipopolysaccharide transport system permease protein